MKKSERNSFDSDLDGKDSSKANAARRTHDSADVEGEAAGTKSAAASNEADQAAIDELLDEVMNNVDEDDCGADEQSGSESDTESDPLTLAQMEAEQYRDRFTRLQAEWDNFRKRTAQERDNERQRAASKLVERLLPIIDDLERAIEHSESASEASLKEGIAAVYNKLGDVLAKEGLKTINPVGEAFDANIHQAVGKSDDTTVPDETVTQVYQKGYQMGDKVLRSAMVIVSAGGPVREADVEDEGSCEQASQ